VANHHVLQRKAGFKSQTSSAETPRIGRAAISISTRAAVGVAPAELGVDGPRLEAEGARRRRHGVGHASLVGRRPARRRDVDGFLERRSVQRIGLVEQRQHVQRAAGEDAFERQLGAGDERFDQDEGGGVGIGTAQGRVREQPLEPSQRVASDARSSARMTPRLPDSITGLITHGNPTPPGAVTRSARTRARSRGRREEPRLADGRVGGRRQPRAHEQLVRRRRHRGRARSRQAQPARRGRGTWRQLATDGQHGGDRRLARVRRRRSRGRASGSLKSITSELAGQCHERSST
jgi:hypothetical protein